jgi:uncharacterized protein
MNADLENLKALQRAENELRGAESQLGEVPGLQADLEAQLAEDRGRLEAAREALDACQKARKRHEGELQDLESRRSKYKGQLMEVKTNKEYTAVLHEIEGVEREIREREDVILEEMERAESLAAEVKREEQALKAAQQRHDEEVRQLRQRAEALEGERGRLEVNRDEVAARLPDEILELFQRVARRRGVAVAEARDGACQVCHVVLRPQMYVDLKRNDAVMQCPSCNRILYFEPPAPEAVPPQP